MDKIINKAKKIIVILLILVSGITYLSIYLPMENELEKTTLGNFILMAKANENTMEQYVERCLEGASSLSSRSMIRNKIIDYRKNLVDISGLSAYTTPLYADGVKALQNVRGSFRIVDKQVITTFGSVDLKKVEKASEIDILTYDLEMQDDNTTLVAYSPIKNNETLIGHDVVFYDMNGILKQLNEDQIQFLILEKTDAQNFLSKKNRNTVVGDVHLLDDGNFTGYIKSFEGSDKYFYVRISNNILFKSIRRISIITFIGFVFGIFLFILLTNWITIKGAQRMLNQEKLSKEAYRQYAIRDTLTGAYSRLILNKWIEEPLANFDREDCRLSVIMLDVDDFKIINDKFGHMTGDKVLQKISAILQSSVRNEDFVIRYGGDEFLVILKNSDITYAEAIIQRVQDRLKEIKEFEFDVKISFGIQEVENKSALFLSIEEADAKMYFQKKSKNITT